MQLRPCKVGIRVHPSTGCTLVWYTFKGTASINLLVVLECLKDRAFDSADCLRSFVIMPLAIGVWERFG